MADIGVYCAFILGGIMSYEVVARPLRVAVLTVSDPRTLETDRGAIRSKSSWNKRIILW